jgi:Holliday junction resolvase RusA-like endonuclease
MMQGPFTPIKGKYTLEIFIWGLRKNADVDNYGKVISDYLQRIELIENDKLCRRISIERMEGSPSERGRYVLIRVIKAT